MAAAGSEAGATAPAVRPAEASIAAFMRTKLPAASGATVEGYTSHVATAASGGASGAGDDASTPAAGWWVIGPEAQFANYNAGILRPPPEALSMEAVRRTLASEVAEFKEALEARHAGGCWWVGPASGLALAGPAGSATAHGASKRKPDDVDALFEGLGFKWVTDEAGMALRFEVEGGEGGQALRVIEDVLKAGVEGIGIAEATTARDVEFVAYVMETACEYGPGRREALLHTYAAWKKYQFSSACDTPFRLKHYYAYDMQCGGGVCTVVPVATCTVLVCPEAAAGAALPDAALAAASSTVGIYDVAVMPEYRRRGIGALMTAVAIQKGRALAPHASVAALQATPEGEGLYLKLGFNKTGEVCRCYSYDGTTK